MTRIKKIETTEDIGNESTEKLIEKVIKKNTDTKFSKEQILELEEYRYLKDVVSAVLEDKEYLLETAHKLIKSYLNKEVN